MEEANVITSLKLNDKGRLGNQMFQIASIIGLSEKYNYQACFPKWKYADFFETKVKHLDTDNKEFITIKEKEYNYHDWKLTNNHINIEGWLQSEFYFNKKTICKVFQFKESLLRDLKQKHLHFFSRKTILIGVRRGDFINHPHYYQVGFTYYLKALFHFFPDWKERNIIFTSDDVEYCKKHFSFLKNSFFMEHISDIEQMALGTLFDDYIISNSTYAWWTAWLGEKETSKIIRPVKNFRKEFAKNNNDKDFFPERWIKFDDKKSKLSQKYFYPVLKSKVYDFNFNTRYFINKYWYQIKQSIKKVIK